MQRGAPTGGVPSVRPAPEGTRAPGRGRSHKELLPQRPHLRARPTHFPSTPPACAATTSTLADASWHSFMNTQPCTHAEKENTEHFPGHAVLLGTYANTRPARLLCLRDPTPQSVVPWSPAFLLSPVRHWRARTRTPGSGQTGAAPAPEPAADARCSRDSTLRVL